jgi:uncharacterized membrane protein
MPRPGFLYGLTLTGHLGTFTLLLAWYTWLVPSRLFPVALVLLVLVLPLLLPLRGILHARRYTIAWSCFLALLYFTHGVVTAWEDAVDGPLGQLEVLTSSLWFLGGIGYIRVARRGTRPE